jgi:hypothetical protein
VLQDTRHGSLDTVHLPPVTDLAEGFDGRNDPSSRGYADVDFRDDARTDDPLSRVEQVAKGRQQQLDMQPPHTAHHRTGRLIFCHFTCAVRRQQSHVLCLCPFTIRADCARPAKFPLPPSRSFDRLVSSLLLLFLLF